MVRRPMVAAAIMTVPTVLRAAHTDTTITIPILAPRTDITAQIGFITASSWASVHGMAGVGAAAADTGATIGVGAADMDIVAAMDAAGMAIAAATDTMAGMVAEDMDITVVGMADIMAAAEPILVVADTTAAAAVDTMAVAVVVDSTAAVVVADSTAVVVAADMVAAVAIGRPQVL
jgi:hypothetical protein